MENQEGKNLFTSHPSMGKEVLPFAMISAIVLPKSGPRVCPPLVQQAE
jgi:hypothetical protein